ncbi:hypothetical protein [Streptomyces sp. NPDC006134]|uniref:hypothetical protein n=1 Tax=Streptomyces sp. NPDC006134 TaxID=3154467 RepID=UPI0033C08593
MQQVHRLDGEAATGEQLFPLPRGENPHQDGGGFLVPEPDELLARCHGGGRGAPVGAVGEGAVRAGHAGRRGPARFAGARRQVPRRESERAAGGAGASAR